MTIQKTQMTINDAKNFFVQWLEQNNANPYIYDITDYDFYTYYSTVSGFVGENYHRAYFMVRNEKTFIEFKNDTTDLKNLSIDEFITILKA